MVVHQCFATKFRHAAGIMHTNHDHGPLSDKSDPLPSQFAGYGPEDDGKPHPIPLLVVLSAIQKGTTQSQSWRPWLLSGQHHITPITSTVTL